MRDGPLDRFVAYMYNIRLNDAGSGSGAAEERRPQATQAIHRCIDVYLPLLTNHWNFIVIIRKH